MTKKEILNGLKSGRILICDRKDDPNLPWLLDDPRVANSGIIQEDEQTSYIKFWWKEITHG